MNNETPTVDPSLEPAKSFDGFPPSGQVEGLPSSILDKFWQEKFLDPKNPGCESSILPGWKMGVGGKVGVGVLNGFCWMLGCCFFFLSPDLWFWMIRFDEQFILFYLCSKMLQAERSMEGLWFGIFPGYVRCFCFGAVEFGMVPHLVESEGVFWFLLLGEGHPPKICGIQWY